MNLAQKFGKVVIIFSLVLAYSLVFCYLAKGYSDSIRGMPLLRPSKSWSWDIIEMCTTREVIRYLHEENLVSSSVSNADLENYILLAEQMCSKYENVSPGLAIAVMSVESKFLPDAYNGSAKGLMQLVPKWHADRMKSYLQRDPISSDWFRPDANIECGVNYLNTIIESVEGLNAIPSSDKLYFSLMWYNQGAMSASKTYLGDGVVSDYAKTVASIASDLDEVYAKGDMYRA